MFWLIMICVLEGARKEEAGEFFRVHREKRPRGLFLKALAAFTRVLTAITLERIQRFFERQFKGWTLPHRLLKILQTGSVACWKP